MNKIKDKVIILSMFVGLMFLGHINMSADCTSCDSFLDNGKCNKDDINNKFCGIGYPRDCYTGTCKPSRVPPQF